VQPVLEAGGASGGFVHRRTSLDGAILAAAEAERLDNVDFPEPDEPPTNTWVFKLKPMGWLKRIPRKLMDPM
jgi:hypothetical protein